MSCPICGGILSDGETVIVKRRGLQTLRKFSELRNDGLIGIFQAVDTITLHSLCRKRYTKENARGIYKPLPPPSSTVKLPYVGTYPFQEVCFFCDELIQGKTHVCIVSNDTTKSTIVKALYKTPSEKNEAILRRIKDVDLKMAMARYHRKCYSDCIKPKSGQKRGRPEDDDVNAAMETIYEYMEESSDTRFSLRELKGLLKDGLVPDDRTILHKLIKRHGYRILVSRCSGDVTINFRHYNDSISEENWHQNGNNSMDSTLESWQHQNGKNSDEEKLRIIKRAGDIIREDICRKVFDSDVNPTPQFFLEKAKDNVPGSLGLFLNTLAGNRAETEEIQIAAASNLLLVYRSF